jgi:hypothetical protein
VKEIFLVLIRNKSKKEFCVGSKARDDFFYTKTHTPRVCCKTTHTLKHARRERERERERGNDDADDGAYYYYYYFCSFR